MGTHGHSPTPGLEGAEGEPNTNQRLCQIDKGSPNWVSQGSRLRLRNQDRAQ